MELKSFEKPLALDLCCGKGGWTKGLLAAGWDVIGVDIKQWEGFPEDAFFIKKDVRYPLSFHEANFVKTNTRKGMEGRKISLVVASPPCQEFSYRYLPFGRVRNLPQPDKSIWEACLRIAKECDCPIIIENVIGAQEWMGKAKLHYGSIYLWGDVPALIPSGKHVKGFGDLNSKTAEYCKFGSKSKERKEFSAQAAMIPFELSRWIGECFKP
jgi:site-specific DNA-cytosine methylase